MDNIRSLDKINDSVRELIRQYLDKLITVYGDRIVSVSVYGSAVSGEFDPKKSDINILLILDKIELPDLKKYSEEMKRFGKAVNPLILTREYIRSSQDVYPMEFLEMKDRYAAVYMEDILAGINIERKYLRLECEQQLKGSLLKLRQGFLRTGSPEGLINESVSTIITIFRNLIRLKGEEPPSEKEMALEKTAEIYGFDKNIFISVYRHKTGHEKMSKNELENCFDKYLKELDNVIDKVDKL